TDFMSPRGHFGGYQVIFCGFVNSAIKRTFSVAFVLEHSVHRGCSENHRTGRGVNSRSSLVEISSRPFGYRIIELLFAREYPQRLNKTRKFGSPTGDDAPTSETCVESPLSPVPAFADRRGNGGNGQVLETQQVAWRGICHETRNFPRDRLESLDPYGTLGYAFA